ncbi:radical SAM protein [Clostridium sp. WILCCON 0269]|uniref:Radical SAM protein n=1 Tax=Candidatus Clostridium eludens TaxID=3381663 RepID=A0ABW8SMM5_9CLOT
MKVGLMDVDSHNFPNLALMKISAWHKAMGDIVEWLLPMMHYDKAYISKVFTFSKDFNTCISADEIIKGGTGYGLKDKLPQDIEHSYPDYSLYNIKDTAYGFLTRGCPRGCEFCIVGEKEGKRSYKVADLREFWNGQQKIKLLDPNLLASKEHLDLLGQLAESKAWVDFTQGVDIRLVTSRNIELIKKLKIDVIHFAWDDINDNLLPKFKELQLELQLPIRKIKAYVLTNFNSTHEEDLYRVYSLRDIGVDPYVMIYEKETAPRETRLLQRWVNNKIVFRTCTRFENFNSKLA